MRTLYLMRHGQTYFNLWHKIQGSTDSPLTPEGIQQAKNVGKYFKENHITFDKAYSSTSERACDTLELTTGLTQHQYDRLKGLKEWGFGSFEAQDERLNPPVPYGDFFVKYGGEDQKAVQTRMHDTISKIMANTQENENVIIVSHSGAIFNFMLAIGLDVNKMLSTNFSNCTVVKLTYEDGKFTFDELINKQN